MKDPIRAATTLMAMALAACGGDASETVTADSGQALYAANCTECHGDQGLGDGPLAPTLPVQPVALMEHLGHHPQAQLVRLIQEGVPPAMPPAPLTEPEVRLVIDYMWTLVPESMVEELRDMQQKAEMGMEMDMDMEMDMEMDMGTPDSSSTGMQPDTTGR